MSENLFGFFKPQVEKSELFDFEFITLVKREGDKDNYKIQLSKSAKDLFDFEGYPEQKVGVIADLGSNTFKLVNLGKTDLEGPGILNIAATGRVSSKELYIALAEAFELDITEDAYLKVELVTSTNVNDGDKTTIEIVSMPDEETINEELAREEEVAKAQLIAESGLEEEEDEVNFVINEDIPESDEFGL